MNSWLVAAFRRLANRRNELHQIRINFSQTFVPIHNITIAMLRNKFRTGESHLQPSYRQVTVIRLERDALTHVFLEPLRVWFSWERPVLCLAHEIFYVRDDGAVQVGQSRVDIQRDSHVGMVSRDIPHVHIVTGQELLNSLPVPAAIRNKHGTHTMCVEQLFLPSQEYCEGVAN